MSRGQGFARRVTAANLKRFALLLAMPADRKKRSSKTSAREPIDPAFTKAEQQFSGTPIVRQRPFKRAPKRRLSSQPAPGNRGPGPEVGVVLFAELSKGSDRWSQANFHKHLFANFFRARAGQRVMLWRVERSGDVIPEPRSRVSVRSKNHRIELKAAAGLDYPPAPGRPIAVFVPVAPRNFSYTLLMPGSRGHRIATKILEEYATRGRLMRQVLISHSDAEAAWPSSPLWNAQPGGGTRR